ncbi:MAG: hypothetical protein WED10_04105 [Brumimicrobium sp.]
MKNKKLNEKYTDKELAESFVFRNDLSPKEKEQADIDLKEMRNKLRDKLTPEKRLLTHLLQLKYQIEDYLKSPNYDSKLSFSFFLRKYLEILNKKNKEFARDISVAETELSQILNQHRKPSEKIIIRLEIHSNKIIPAITWYRLLEKQRAYEILTDKKLRVRERSHVSNILKVS